MSDLTDEELDEITQMPSEVAESEIGAMAQTIREQRAEIERLREDGDATRERSNGWAVAATEAARCADDRDAIIAEQAKEIERLRKAKCCESCGLAYPWHAVGCHFCPEGRAYDDQ